MSDDAKITRGAMHLHTRRSFDSLADPREIVKEALRWRLDFISVCDHDNLVGSQEVSEAAAEMGVSDRLTVLVGAEYLSHDGDLVCLGIESPIETREPAELISATHAQGGLVILPHPYRGHHNIERLAAAVDMIEAINVRCTSEEDRKAGELAERFGKPAVCGSDAHMIHQVAHCTIEFEGRWDLTDLKAVAEMLLNAPRQLHLRRRFDPAAVAFCQLISATRWDGLISRIQKGIFLRNESDAPNEE